MGLFSLGSFVGLVIGAFVMWKIFKMVLTEMEKRGEIKAAKIEALQEENSLLHDEVFNLNQALMKEME